MYLSSQWKSTRSTINLCLSFFKIPISVTRLSRPFLERLLLWITWHSTVRGRGIVRYKLKIPLWLRQFWGLFWCKPCRQSPGFLCQLKVTFLCIYQLFTRVKLLTKLADYVTLKLDVVVHGGGKGQMEIEIDRNVISHFSFWGIKIWGLKQN